MSDLRPRDRCVPMGVLLASSAISAVLMPWSEWVPDSHWKPAYYDWFVADQPLMVWNGLNGNPYAPWVLAAGILTIVSHMLGRWLRHILVIHVMCFVAITVLCVWDVWFVEYANPPATPGGHFRPSYGPYLGALAGVLGVVLLLPSVGSRIRTSAHSAGYTRSVERPSGS
jgi:hypothetical protein